jgi:hypothetical protein
MDVAGALVVCQRLSIGGKTCGKKSSPQGRAVGNHLNALVDHVGIKQQTNGKIKIMG